MYHTVALLLFLAVGAKGALADSIVAVRTLPSQTVLAAADLAVEPGDQPSAWSGVNDLLGLETRRVIYQGRPIRPEDVGPPAVLERNQAVTLVYRAGGLEISVAGRSLSRAAAGERVKAMNLASRNIVSGIAQNDGSVRVGEGG